MRQFHARKHPNARKARYSAHLGSTWSAAYVKTPRALTSANPAGTPTTSTKRPKGGVRNTLTRINELKTRTRDSASARERGGESPPASICSVMEPRTSIVR